MTGIDYALVIGFLAVMAMGGLWISRLIKDSDDFFVAGRELTPFILAATITATNLSMFHFVGMGGTAYKNGISIIWQNWTGCIALVLSGIFVLPLMRRLRIRSVPEFLEMRYSRGLRTIVGAFWGLRLCIYLGLLLYLAATTAIVITGWKNYTAWLMIFSLVSILYSAIGGAWAVAIMDSVQFIIMLAGALVVFPVAMHLAGGIPAMIDYFKVAKPSHIDLVPATGGFSWLFVISIMLLGFKWSMIDQAILQRAFGAKSPRVGAKGMVLSGLITVPMAFLWILPGLAVAKARPDGALQTDTAIPWLMTSQLPMIARGLLGFVLCGLVAAQVSTITSDVNSVATLFTSDVYRTLKRGEPTQRQLLFVVRLSSLLCGLFMLIVAWLFQSIGEGGAVTVNLIVVGVLDMPLFIITIVYGLLWRRANWQGALAGFFVGGLGSVGCYLFYVWVRHMSFSAAIDPAKQIAPIVSSIVALIVTPIVSLLTARAAEKESHLVLDVVHNAQADEGDAHPFHLFPDSFAGQAGAIAAIVGFVMFMIGVFVHGHAAATPLAIGGMVIVLVGGMVRVYAR